MKCMISTVLPVTGVLLYYRHIPPTYLTIAASVSGLRHVVRQRAVVN